MADPDYFTLAELRALPDVDDTTAYPDARVLAAAAYFTAIVENEVGYSMVPRSVSETLDGGFRAALVLSKGYVRSLTSVTVDGVAVATNLLTVKGGVVRYLDCTDWSGADLANVTVTYSTGRFAACPADVKDAVMWATRDRLMSQGDQSGVDIRKTSMSTDFGTTTYVLPGEKRPTGYPELDAVIASYQRTSTSLGFA